MEVINNIRSRGGGAAIGLPQAVIVGGQSAGKSSLLEAFSGVPLPFGRGTKTKCPTVIDMHPGASLDFKVAGKDVEKSKVIEAIEAEQNNILEQEKVQFSETPIEVRATTKFEQRITIVDTPGLHENAEKGSVIVNKMAEHAIESVRSLIFAVGEASLDDDRHKSFDLAKDVDPRENRTIKIYTKCDMATGKSDVKDLLERIKKADGMLRGDGSTARLAAHFIIARPFEKEGDDWTHEGELAAFQKQFEGLDCPAGLLKSGVVGIQSLRERSETLLCDLVMLNVPDMLIEYRAKLTKLEQDLRNLGEEPKSSSELLRSCVECLQSAVDELGCKSDEHSRLFEEECMAIMRHHAGDEKAVRKELERTRSMTRIPWYRAVYPFELQLKCIGRDYSSALEVYGKHLMQKIVGPKIERAIVRYCSGEGHLDMAFKRQLQRLSTDILEKIEVDIQGEFTKLAKSSERFNTRNEHYIDGSQEATREKKRSRKAAFLFRTLGGKT